MGSPVGPLGQKLLPAAVGVELLLGLLLAWTSRPLVVSNASLLFWLHFSGFHLLIYNVLRLSYWFCKFSVGLILNSQNKLMLGAEA